MFAFVCRQQIALTKRGLVTRRIKALSHFECLLLSLKTAKMKHQRCNASVKKHVSIHV